jgi:hypothetical protein
MKVMKIKEKKENTLKICGNRHFFNFFETTISRVLVSKMQNKSLGISSFLLANLAMPGSLHAPRVMPRHIHANHTYQTDNCVAPPIPLEVLSEGLAGNCFSERNLRFLREEPLLPGLRYRAVQIFHLCNEARTELMIVHS